MKPVLLWLTQLLSGTDNRTPAIGRVLALIVVAVFLIAAPSAALGAQLAKGFDLTAWLALFGAFATYVPTIAMSAGGLIAGTHFTEPKKPASAADPATAPTEGADHG